MEKDRRDKERIVNLEVYTDGSCKKIGEKTFGGWSYIAVKDCEPIHADSGHEYDTTNQRMELIAIINALKYASAIRRPREKVIIYSDSAYVINCYLKEWYIGWEHNGWVNSQKKDVSNKDLWMQLIPFFDNFWYDFRKVHGHSNVYWNEQCDKDAQREAELIKTKWRGKNV